MMWVSQDFSEIEGLEVFLPMIKSSEMAAEILKRLNTQKDNCGSICTYKLSFIYLQTLGSEKTTGKINCPFRR